MRSRNVPIAALAVLATSLLAQPRSVPEGEWYRSNALGALIERVEWFRANETEWTARLVRRDVEERIDLYRNGRLTETRFRGLDEAGRVRRVRVVRSNRTHDAYELDESGNLVAEEVWVDNRLQGRIEYTWTEGVLTRRRAIGANGRSLYTDEVQRTPEGRIRRIVRRYADRVEWHSWKWGSDGLGSEIGKERDQGFFTAYGRLQQVRRQELYIGGSLFQVSDFEWRGDRIRSQRDLVVPRDYEERRTFDERSQPILIEIRQNRRLIAQERRWYQEDRLIQQVRIANGSVETRLYVYDGSGELEREEVQRNGETEAVYHYQAGKLVREEFFLGGRLVVQTRWEDDEKVEEVYFDAQGRSRTRDLRRSR